MKKRRHITLLEIMIVIFLIGIIGSVIGYNMKGSLDKGKVFRTKESIKQVHDLLLLQVAEGADINDVAIDPLKYLEKSGLAKNPKELIKDGWGYRLNCEYVKSANDIVITSKGLSEYEMKKGKKEKKLKETEEYEQ